MIVLYIIDVCYSLIINASDKSIIFIFDIWINEKVWMVVFCSASKRKTQSWAACSLSNLQPAALATYNGYVAFPKTMTIIFLIVSTSSQSPIQTQQNNISPHDYKQPCHEQGHEKLMCFWLVISIFWLENTDQLWLWNSFSHRWDTIHQDNNTGPWRCHGIHFALWYLKDNIDDQAIGLSRANYWPAHSPDYNPFDFKL